MSDEDPKSSGQEVNVHQDPCHPPHNCPYCLGAIWKTYPQIKEHARRFYKNIYSPSEDELLKAAHCILITHLIYADSYLNSDFTTLDVSPIISILENPVTKLPEIRDRVKRLVKKVTGHIGFKNLKISRCDVIEFTPWIAHIWNVILTQSLVDTHGHARGTKIIQAALDLNPGFLAILRIR